MTFTTEDVQVNENNGTVFVCVMRSAVTEDDLTIPIAITTSTADSEYTYFMTYLAQMLNTYLFAVPCI